MNSKLLLGSPELANMLSLAPKDAAKMFTDGVIPVVECGGVKRVRVADVEKYVAELPAMVKP